MASTELHSKLLLPGPTMEFDPSTADIGGTVGTADHGMACCIPADGNSGRDTEIPHIQIKRAAVPSVKRHITAAAKLSHNTFECIDGEIFSHSHKDVLDPPVSTHTDKGTSNGHLDTRPCHQIH